MSSPDITFNHHGGNEESTAAFESSDFSAIREAVFDFILSRGATGATTDEVLYHFEQQHQTLGNSTIAARVSELKRDQRIIASGDKRKTRRNKPAAVNVALRFKPSSARGTVSPKRQDSPANPVFAVDKDPGFAIDNVCHKCRQSAQIFCHVLRLWCCFRCHRRLPNHNSPWSCL